jgi:mRNA interferase RelE/StbE
MEPKKFTVKLNEQSKKTLTQFSKNERKQIIAKLIQLEDNPYKDARKFIGMEFWCLREGYFRIIYTIDNGVLLVLVIRIGLRKDIYKRL